MSAISAAAGSRSAASSAARSAAFGLAVVGGAIAFGVLAGVLSANGKAIDVVGLAVVLLPVAVWKRPYIGPIMLLCTAVLFEQVVSADTPQAGFVPGIGDVLPPPALPITSHVHVFEGLGSVHLEGADLLLFVIAAIFLLRTRPAERAWPRSHVSRSMAWLMGAVVLGIFIGISHHGQMRVALMESRPYVYLAAAYVLTASLIRTRSAMRTVLWAFVIATGLKAAQGVYEFFLVMSWHPRPEAVMGHEDAYTFGVYIFLVAGLWLFQAPIGKLRKVATWLLPVVIAANLFNNRRAAWLLLGGGLIVLMIIGWRCVPERRQRLKKILIGVLVFSAAYVPAYWNKTGTLAQPARAIHSMISPDVRDAASNLYRTQEDANLKYNIREGGVLGKGFGVPIDYALPIVDISKEDPNIKFIPHNGVLYIPMRMGLLGTIAFWTLLGTGIIAGCRLAKSREREIAAVGALLACSLVAYALEGATDQGFYFYRIAFITGTVLGLAEAARRIQRTTPLTIPYVGVPAGLAPATAMAGLAPEPTPELVPAGVAERLTRPLTLVLEPMPAQRTLRTHLTGLSRVRLLEMPATRASTHGHEARPHSNGSGARGDSGGHRGDSGGHGARTHSSAHLARGESNGVSALGGSSGHGAAMAPEPPDTARAPEPPDTARAPEPPDTARAPEPPDTARAPEPAPCRTEIGHRPPGEPDVGHLAPAPHQKHPGPWRTTRGSPSPDRIAAGRLRDPPVFRPACPAPQVSIPASRFLADSTDHPGPRVGAPAPEAGRRRIAAQDSGAPVELSATEGMTQ